MPRALWKGSISFGLVNIPIELHTAVRNHRPKFRMLHAKDHSPVRFERVCIRDGHPVAWEDLVKGYEYERGHFVVLTVMRFADELVDVAQFDLPSDSAIRKPELEMAKALVNSLAAAWDPSKYTDQYRENLKRVIQGKAKGKHVTLTGEKQPRHAEVVDLMERLRRSLETAKPKRSAKKPSKKRTRAA